MIDALPNRPLSLEHAERLAEQLEKFTPIAWDDDRRPYAIMLKVGEDHVVAAFNVGSGGWEVVDRLDSPDPRVASEVVFDWLDENPADVDLNVIDAELRRLNNGGSDE